MNRSRTLLALGTLMAAVSLAAIPDPVKTDSGSVAGTSNTDASVRMFKGIPSRLRRSAICGGKWHSPQPSGRRGRWQRSSVRPRNGAAGGRGGRGRGGKAERRESAGSS